MSGGSATPTKGPGDLSSHARAVPRAADGIKISALDHVHIYVADVDAAADWYGRVLGLERSAVYVEAGRHLADRMALPQLELRPFDLLRKATSGSTKRSGTGQPYARIAVDP